MMMKVFADLYNDLSRIFTTRLNTARAFILVSSVFLAILLLAFRSIDDLDYGIHLATGRWILDNWRVPTTDPFSWATKEHPYVAYHWGFQALLAAAYRLCDHLGAVLLRFFIIAATALVLFRALCFRGVPALLGSSVALLALIACEWRFSVRPELFSILLLASAISVGDRWRAGNARAIWQLIPITLIWVNTHIYILGAIVLLAHLFESLVSKRQLKTLLICAMACALVCFINPYGLDAVLEPMRLVTRLGKGNIFAKEIAELASPFNLPSERRFLFTLNAQWWSYVVLLILAVPASVGLFIERRLADLIILLAFALLSTFAMRNISLFAVAATPLLASGLLGLFKKTHGTESVAARSLSVALTVTALLLSLRVANGAYYAYQRRQLSMTPSVERAALAFGAGEFLEANKIEGRGFNTLNVGGALLLTAPNHPTFIDGRNEVTGEEFFSRYLEIMKPNSFDEFVSREKIEYLVLGYPQAINLIRAIADKSEWRMVYYDATAVIFVRADGLNSKVPEAALPEPIIDTEDRWKLLHSIDTRPGAIDSFARWLGGLEKPNSYQDKVGTLLLTTGKWEQAEKPLLEAARAAPNFWETSNNLAALYSRQRRWEEAAFAYRGIIMLDPDNQRAIERAEISFLNFQARLWQEK